jgi:basic amino acid/polyamine antiporter, APA family
LDQSTLARKLGLWDATMLVAGSMIGSGIFIVSAEMSRQIGSGYWLLFLWAFSGFLTLLAALSYGELAGMMPQAGGQFVYIKKAFGNLPSFLYGWTVFSVIQTGVIAAVAMAFVKYTAIFLPQLSSQIKILEIGSWSINRSQIGAILLIVFLTFINTRGVNTGKWIQSIFTFSKVSALIALVICGFWIGSDLNLWEVNFANRWSATQTIWENQTLKIEPLSGFALILALGTASIGSLFSSDAWNNVTFIAGEIKNPEKNLPRSLILGVGGVCFLYFLANVAYLGILPMQGIPEGKSIIENGIQFAPSDRVGTSAAWMIFGNKAVWIMAGLIMVSTFGCNNGIIMAGARVYYAMAKEKLFFKKAGELNRFGVPGRALTIQAIWASILCLSGSYGALLDYTTFASLIFYVVTISGIFILRKKIPNHPRPYKVPFFPFLPIIYIIFALSICIILLITKPESTQAGLFIVLLGIPIYFIAKLNKSNHNSSEHDHQQKSNS